MFNFQNFSMRATLKDGRTFVGTLRSFDKHMNLILIDTEEYRQTRPKKGQVLNEQKRPLGFVLLRGEHVSISTSVLMTIILQKFFLVVYPFCGRSTTK